MGECMTARSYHRGHAVHWLVNPLGYSEWVYSDTNEAISDVKPRPCKRCGKMPTKEGYDACQGHVPGADSVCCGHGESEQIMMMGMERDCEVRKLRKLGAGVGDILEGDDSNGPDRILITAIGRDKFLCIWDYQCKGDFSKPESGNTTLSCRKWKKVGSIYGN